MSRKSLKSDPAIIFPNGCEPINEKLVKSELIKRLRDLYEYFNKQEQDEDLNEEFKPLVKYLASRFFLNHQDREVKMFTACILADGMRIFAPNAPFSPTQLRNVLKFFVSQLSELQQQSSAVFRYAFYLLDVVSSTRLLCAYLEFEDECPAFFCNAMDTVLSAVKKEHAQSVKTMVTDLCVPLLEETPVVTVEMLDCLFSRIVEPAKSGNPTLYKIVVDIIAKARDSLEAPFSNFFRMSLTVGSFETSQYAKHAYSIIYDLCLSCIDVVHNVITNHVRAALELDQENLRLAAVKFASQLFSRRSGVGTLYISKFPTVWITYLGRHKDASGSIRSVWVKQAVSLLNSLSWDVGEDAEIGMALFERLEQRALDSEFLIRIAVIDATVAFAQQNISVVPDSLLRKIESLTWDRHAKTRTSAVLALGKIYRRVCMPVASEVSEADNENSGGEQDNEKILGQKARLSWIRNKILLLYRAHSSLEDRALVERVLYACLVPVTTLSPARRLEELIIMYASLDNSALICFETLIRNQFSLRETVHNWASSALANSSGSVRTKYLGTLCELLPSEPCSREVLSLIDGFLVSNKTFAENLKTVTTNTCSSTKASEMATEIVKSVNACQTFPNPKQKTSVISAVKFILERTLPLLVSGPSFVGLLRVILRLIAGESIASGQINVESTSSILKLCRLISQIFKHGCLHVDAALFDDDIGSDHFKFVLDNFLSLFDQLTSNDELAQLAQILPYIVTSSNLYQSQSSQFYLTMHALQSTLGNLSLREHAGLAKHATKCLIHLLTSSEYLRVIKPIVESRTEQIHIAIKKMLSLTGELEESSSPDVDFHSGTVSYYSLSQIVVFLPKTFFNEMRSLAYDTWDWLSIVKKRGIIGEHNFVIAALKFLSRWVSCLRKDQHIHGSLPKDIGDCLASYVIPLTEGSDSSKASIIAIKAATCCLHLLKSNEVILANLPVSPIVALGKVMENMTKESLKTSMHSFFVKTQRLFVERTLPPMVLAIISCCLLSSDKELKATAREFIFKLVHAWRVQARIHPNLSTDDETEGLILNKLPESFLPSSIILFSFLSIDDINKQDICRQAISIIFDILTSQSPNELKANPNSEHLPLCSSFVANLKELAPNVASSFSPPEFSKDWNSNCLVSLVNIAMAEIPRIKGKDIVEVQLNQEQYFTIIGPFFNLFRGDVAVKPSTPKFSSHSSPLSNTSATDNIIHKTAAKLKNNEVLSDETPEATEIQSAKKNLRCRKRKSDDDAKQKHKVENEDDEECVALSRPRRQAAAPAVGKAIQQKRRKK